VRRSPDTVPRDHVDASLPDLRSTSKLYRSPWSDDLLSWVSVRASRPIGPEDAPFAPPPTPCDASTPARRATSRIGLGEPSPKSRSVRVVSHHLDGFLRIAIRGLVASRCRSWGSRVSTVASPTEGRGRSGFLTAQDSYPSKEPPDDSRTASPRPLPPCRSPPCVPRARAAPLLGRRLHGSWARGIDFEALLHHRVPESDRTIAGADDPVLPGLRSPSRSFAMAGDPSPTTTPGAPPRGD